jgi:hypothetical protein
VRAAVRAIVFTGLIVGAMDITSAFILVLSRGSTIPRLLQFIASGILGPKAFEGGTATAALGLALQFFIALTLVALLYAASRQLLFLQQHAVVSGIIYGLAVYAVMNLVVLPLSAAKPRHSITGDLIQIGIHMFIIGLPTALLLRRFSGANDRTMVIPRHD